MRACPPATPVCQLAHRQRHMLEFNQCMLLCTIACGMRGRWPRARGENLCHTSTLPITVTCTLTEAYTRTQTQRHGCLASGVNAAGLPRALSLTHAHAPPHAANEPSFKGRHMHTYPATNKAAAPQPTEPTYGKYPDGPPDTRRGCDTHLVRHYSWEVSAPPSRQATSHSNRPHPDPNRPSSDRSARSAHTHVHTHARTHARTHACARAHTHTCTRTSGD